MDSQSLVTIRGTKDIFYVRGWGCHTGSEGVNRNPVLGVQRRGTRVRVVQKCGPTEYVTTYERSAHLRFRARRRRFAATGRSQLKVSVLAPAHDRGGTYDCP